MLRIVVPETEYYDDARNLFIQVKEQKLVLEHSLLSVSKWESKWKKPFLSDNPNDKTPEQALDYVRCMTVNYNTVDPNCYRALTADDFKQINEYIADPMTATTFNDRTPQSARPKRREVITSEIIYYDMTVLNIPFECEKWHLNRLLTLINVCRIKNEPPKKMKKADALSQRRALNDARRAKYHTHG